METGKGPQEGRFPWEGPGSWQCRGGFVCKWCAGYFFSAKQLRENDMNVGLVNRAEVGNALGLEDGG